jgi:hypothetical protein
MPTYNVTDPTTGKTLSLTGESPPTEQELTQIFGQAQPAQPSQDPIGDIFRAGEQRRQAQELEAANAPSMIGSMARGARESIGAGIGGIGGAALGIALAPATGGLSVGIPLVAGLAGGALGGMAQGAVDPLTAERQAALQRDMETNPVSSWVGSIAPSIVTAKPSISGIGTAMRSMSGAATALEKAAITNARINAAAGAGIGGGVNLGMSALQGQAPTLGSFAGDVLLGATFNEPNRLGRALGMQPSVRPVMPNEAPAVITTTPSEAAAPVPLQTTNVPLAEGNVPLQTTRPGYLGPEGPTGPIVKAPVVTGPTGPVVTGPVVKGPVVGKAPAPSVQAEVPAALPIPEGFGPTPPTGPVVSGPTMVGPQGPVVSGPEGPIVRKPVVGERPVEPVPPAEAVVETPTATQPEQPPAPITVEQATADLDIAKQNLDALKAAFKTDKSLVEDVAMANQEVVLKNNALINLTAEKPVPKPVEPVNNYEPKLGYTPPEGLTIEGIEADYQSALRLADSNPDKVAAGEKRKAAGMVKSAEIRKLTGRFTPKEQAKIDKRLAGNYEGKPVSVDGENGVVVKQAFGKTKVRFADGTESSFSPDRIAPPVEKPPSAAIPAAEPTITNESQANAQGQANAEGQGETLLTTPEPAPAMEQAAPPVPQDALFQERTPKTIRAENSEINKSIKEIDGRIKESTPSQRKELTAQREKNVAKIESNKAEIAALEKQRASAKSAAAAETKRVVNNDFITWMEDNPVFVPEKKNRTGGEYDAFTPDFMRQVPPQYKKLFSSQNGRKIDTVVQAAYEAGYIKELTTEALLNKFMEAKAQRKTGATRSDLNPEEAKLLAAEEAAPKQAEEFAKAIDDNRMSPEGTPVQAGDLSKGDSFVFEGEKIKVIGSDVVEGFNGPEGSVVVKDGDKFGTQVLDANENIRVTDKTSDNNVWQNERDEAQAKLQKEAAPADEGVPADEPSWLGKPEPKPVEAEAPAAKATESPMEKKNFNNKSLFEPAPEGDAFTLKSEETIDGVKVTQAADNAAANEALNDSLQTRLGLGDPDAPPLSKDQVTKVIDFIDGQIKAADDYIGKNKNRFSSLPIDILGVDAYKGLLQLVKAGLKAGQSIGKAVGEAMKSIKDAKITREQRRLIARELEAHAAKSLELGKGRDADIKVQVGLIAESIKDIKGRAPSRLELVRELTAKFPDQAQHIRKNLNKIMDEMVAQETTIKESKSQTSKEWASWGRERTAQLNELYNDSKSGLSAKKMAQTARAIHDHIFTNMGQFAHNIADGVHTGRASKVLKEWSDKVFLLKPGTDGVNRVGIDILQETESTKFLNQIGRHLEDLQKTPEFIAIADPKKAGFMERIVEHVVDPSRDKELAKNPALKKSVDFFSGIRGNILSYLKTNNIEIGDLGPRSMSRTMDPVKVFSNREAFLRDTANAYRAKWGAELKSLAEESAKYGQGSKEQKAFLKKIDQVKGFDADNAARKYLAAIELGERGLASDGNDFFSSEGGLTPNIFKAREFGPEAEVFLRKYMDNNPFDMIKNEIIAATRAVTKARLLGGFDKNGKWDNLGGWKALRDEMIAEGNMESVPLIQQVIKNYLNVKGTDNVTSQKILQGIHGLTQLTYLSRAALSSLPEATMVGVRAGSLREAVRANKITASNFVKLVRKGTPSQGLIVAEALGEIKIGQHAMMGSESISNAFGGRGVFGNLVSKFHEKTFLADWTSATMGATMDIGKSFIGMNLKLIKENSSMARMAMQNLRELGIERADVESMLKFSEGMSKEKDWSKIVLADTAEAAKFRDALTLFKRTGGALDPTRASKTMASTNPLASLFYSLSGYLYEFHDKITRRYLYRAKAGITGKMMMEGEIKQLTGAERSQIFGEIAKGAAVLYATQYAVQLMRENLYADPERIAKDKRRTAGEVATLRAKAALSRASVFGPYDAIFNAITQARYQRDPATTLLGAEIGGMSDLFGQIANIMNGERNAPGTNTAERKLTRSIYNMTVAPAIGALSATMPGYGVPGVLIQGAYHPAIREQFVKGIAGPPVLPKSSRKSDK